MAQEKLTFQHGPVTITVEGLPESVLPATVHLEMGVHYAYHPEADRDSAFIRDFGALGGTDTFQVARPDNKFSVYQIISGVAAGVVTRSTSKLQLFAPGSDRGDKASAASVIAAAIAISEALDAEEDDSGLPCGGLGW